MINHFLKLTDSVSISDTTSKKISSVQAIANKIHSSPWFNGNLVLSGQLAGTMIRNKQNNENFVIEELSKVKTVDVTNLSNLDVYNNFTNYCINIRDYKGISKEKLLSTRLNIDLNIDAIDFTGIELDVEALAHDFSDASYWQDRHLGKRLKIAVSNGATIKHFELTGNFVIEHRTLVDLIDKKNYTTPTSEIISLNDSLSVIGLNRKDSEWIRPIDSLIRYGFIQQQLAYLSIDNNKEYKISSDNNSGPISLSLDSIKCLLQTGTIIEADSACLKCPHIVELAVKYPNLKLPITEALPFKQLDIDFKHLDYISVQLTTESQWYDYYKSILDANANYVENYAKLGIRFKETSFKYKSQQKLYARYRELYEKLHGKLVLYPEKTNRKPKVKS